MPDRRAVLHHNGRPAIVASSLPPNLLRLVAGKPPRIVCPVCGVWCPVTRRKIVAPHRAEDGKTRCPGSSQRVVIDLTPKQWHDNLLAAEREASTRRVKDTQRKPPIPRRWPRKGIDWIEPLPLPALRPAEDQNRPSPD